MAQIMVDLMDFKRNDKLLQNLFDAQQNLMLEHNKESQPIPELVKSSSDTESTDGSDTFCLDDILLAELCNHPVEYYIVVLDSDVENILQNLPDDVFVNCFHFDRVIVRCLLMELHRRTHYHPLSDMCDTIGFDVSVLVTLSYLVNGHFDYISELNCFRYYSLDQFKVCIQKICEIFVNFLCPVYVKFPGSSEEIEPIKSEFLQKFHVPGVVGALGCYYVALSNIPINEQHMYLNRNCREPSLVLQLISDTNYRFLDANPRFSGSASNTHVWNHSNCKNIIKHHRKKEPNVWIIGDRSYPLSSGIISPYRKASNMQQHNINVSLMEAHLVVDKSYHLLKGRFRCLNEPLPFNHKHAANIISSCIVLHNYLLANNRSVEENVQYQFPEINPLLKISKFQNESSTDNKINIKFIEDFIIENNMKKPKANPKDKQKSKVIQIFE